MTMKILNKTRLAASISLCLAGAFTTAAYAQETATT